MIVCGIKPSPAPTGTQRRVGGLRLVLGWVRTVHTWTPEEPVNYAPRQTRDERVEQVQARYCINSIRRMGVRKERFQCSTRHVIGGRRPGAGDIVFQNKNTHAVCAWWTAGGGPLSAQGPLRGTQRARRRTAPRYQPRILPPRGGTPRRGLRLQHPQSLLLK